MDRNNPVISNLHTNQHRIVDSSILLTNLFGVMDFKLNDIVIVNRNHNSDWQSNYVDKLFKIVRFKHYYDSENDEMLLQPYGWVHQSRNRMVRPNMDRVVTVTCYRSGWKDLGLLHRQGEMIIRQLRYPHIFDYYNIGKKMYI
jgi:hypothetical protein